MAENDGGRRYQASPCRLAYTCEPHAQKPSGLCSYPLAHRCEALLNVQGAAEMAQQLRALTALRRT